MSQRGGDLAPSGHAGTGLHGEPAWLAACQGRQDGAAVVGVTYLLGQTTSGLLPDLASVGAEIQKGSGKKGLLL